LSLKFEIRRDTSFDIEIGNRNVGINVVDLKTEKVKELVVKHKNIYKLEEEDQL
jgi:hypothetical protein